MKKLFCLCAALSMAAIFAMANPVVTGNDHGVKKKKESRWEPNRATEFHFSKDFSNAKNVSWSFGKFVEATFLDNGVAKTAYYDESDNLVGTTTDVDVTALPEKARDHINKEYPGYSIEKVVFFDDNEANDTDMSLFNQSFEDEDNYFPLLVKGSKEIILKVSPEGDVSFFGNFK
jgi:hypothetical protein